MTSSDNRQRTGNRNNSKDARGGDTKSVVVSDNSTVGPGPAIEAKPLEVIIYSNGNFDKALRAFRTLVQKERVLSSYKERQSYEKPSDKKRRKINEAQRKQLEYCSKGECSHPDHSKNRRPKTSRDK